MSPFLSFLMKRPPLNTGRDLISPVKNEKGFALLLSLLIVFLLVVIIFETDFQIRADLRAAGNFRDDLKAYYLSRSGISAGEALLIDDAKNSSTYDALNELWAAPIPEYPLGDGSLSGFIVDEERKINLNFLIRENAGRQTVAPERKDQLLRLFTLLQVNPDLVDSIIDWIDSDDEPLPFGAETPSYQALDPGYSAKNDRMTTLSELRMVRGITPEIYNIISPYLTVYGAGKLNVNTADPLVLQSIDDGIDETEARRIIEKRPFEQANGQDFKNELPADVDGRIRTDDRINWFTIRSQYFSLVSNGQVNNTRKTTRAIILRNGIQTKLLYFRVE